MVFLSLISLGANVLAKLPLLRNLFENSPLIKGAVQELGGSMGFSPMETNKFVLDSFSAVENIAEGKYWQASTDIEDMMKASGYIPQDSHVTREINRAMKGYNMSRRGLENIVGPDNVGARHDLDNAFENIYETSRLLKRGEGSSSQAAENMMDVYNDFQTKINRKALAQSQAQNEGDPDDDNDEDDYGNFDGGTERYDSDDDDMQYDARDTGEYQNLHHGKGYMKMLNDSMVNNAPNDNVETPRRRGGGMRRAPRPRPSFLSRDRDEHSSGGGLKNQLSKRRHAGGQRRSRLDMINPFYDDDNAEDVEEDEEEEDSGDNDYDDDNDNNDNYQKQAWDN